MESNALRNKKNPALRMLSVLLAVIMLVSVMPMSGLITVKAADSIDALASLLKLRVPETIWLKPARSTATTFQYYSNPPAITATTISDNAGVATAGYIYFQAPAGAGAPTLSWSGPSAVTATRSGPSSNVYTWTITAGTYSTTHNAVNTITWTITFTWQGLTLSVNGYTSVYAPSNYTIGGAGRTQQQWKNKYWTSGVVGITGVQSFVSTTLYAHCSFSGNCTATNTSYSNFNGVSMNSLTNGALDDVYSGGTGTMFAGSNAPPTDYALTTGTTAGNYIYYCYDYHTNKTKGEVRLGATSGRVNVDVTRFGSLNNIPGMFTFGAVTDDEATGGGWMNNSGWYYGASFTNADSYGTGTRLVSPSGTTEDDHWAWRTTTIDSYTIPNNTGGSSIIRTFMGRLNGDAKGGDYVGFSAWMRIYIYCYSRANLRTSVSNAVVNPNQWLNNNTTFQTNLKANATYLGSPLSTTEAVTTMDSSMSNFIAALKLYRSATQMVDATSGAWRDYTLADLCKKSEAELLQMETDIATATNTSNLGKYTTSDTFKDYLTIPNSTELATLKSNIDLVQQAYASVAYASYFHGETNNTADGKWGTLPDFQTPIADDFNPAPSYAGMNLTQLVALYNEAKPKNDALQTVMANTTLAPVLEQLCAAQGIELNATEAAKFMTDLKKVITQWEIFQFAEPLKKAYFASTNYHDGANPNENDRDGNQTSYDQEDPGTIFDNSNYTYSLAQITTWRDAIQTGVNNINSYTTSGYGTLVTAILAVDEFGGPLTAAEINARLTALNNERNYRSEAAAGQGDEAEWYTFRDYFEPLIATDWTEYSNGDIYARYFGAELVNNQKYGVKANITKYNTMKTAAYASAWGSAPSATLGGNYKLADEIYGGYDARITYLVDSKLLAVPAMWLTNEVVNAYNDFVNLAAANHVNISGLNLTTFDWTTFSHIQSLLDRLYEVVYNSKNTYQNLSDAGKLTLLGDSEHTSAWVIEKYNWIVTTVKTEYDKFMADPLKYFKKTDIPDMNRNWRADDIQLESNAVGSQRYNAETGLASLLTKLDAFLGSSGDLQPYITAVGGVDAMLVKLGIDADSFNTESFGVSSINDLFAPINGKVNLATVIEAVVTNMLYTDDFVNMIIGMLYPKVMNSFEDAFYDIKHNGSIPSSVLVYHADAVKVLGVTMIPEINLYANVDVSLNNMHSIVAGGTFAQLQVYPDIFAANAVAAYGTEFQTVRNQLNAAVSGKNWNVDFSNAWAPLIDTEGLAKLTWGINSVADPAARRLKFEHALSAALQGVFPLLRACLLNQSFTISNKIGTAEVEDVASIPADWLVGDLDINLYLDGYANDGYRKVLAPMLETLLGTNLGTFNGTTTNCGIPTLANLQAITTGAQTAATLLGPMNLFLDRVKAAPVDTLLGLLPNLMAALEFNLIPPLLQTRDNLKVQIGMRAYATGNSIVESAIGNGGRVLNDTNAVMVYVADYVDMSDMDTLSSFDHFLSSTGIKLPNNINAAAIASTGTLTTRTDSRRTTTSRRWIEADKPDLLKKMIGWVLPVASDTGAPMPTLEEIVPMLTELVTPKAYPYKLPIHYTADTSRLTDADIYPAWWNDQSSDTAKTDAAYLADNLDTALDAVWRTAFGTGSGALTLNDLVLSFLEETISEEGFIALADVFRDIAVGLEDTDFEETEGILSLFGDMLDDIIKLGVVNNSATGEQSLALDITAIFGPSGFNLPGFAMSDNVRSNTTAAQKAQWGDYWAQYLKKDANGDVVGGTAQLDPDNISDHLTNYVRIYVDALHAGLIPLSVNSITDWTDALVQIIKPLAPIVDWLLEGQTLKVIPVTKPSSDSALIELLGGNGYENFVVPFLNAILAPIGLANTIPTHTAFKALTPTGRIQKIVQLFMQVWTYGITNMKPVDMLARILPNLVWFGTAGTNGVSTLQEALDGLLHPVYTLMDTFRPILDIMETTAQLEEQAELEAQLALDPNYEPPVKETTRGMEFTYQTGLKLDLVEYLQGMVDTMLAEQVAGSPITINIRVEDFALGTVKNGYNATSANGYTSGTAVVQHKYLEADRGAVLMLILKQAGVLDMIADSGYEGFVYFIQNHGFDIAKVDYAAAAPIAARADIDAALPAWVIADGAVDYLDANADAVLDWLWASLYAHDNTRLAINGYLSLASITTDANGDSVPSAVTMQPTLDATIAALFGEQFFTQSNLALVTETIKTALVDFSEMKLFESPDPADPDAVPTLPQTLLGQDDLPGLVYVKDLLKLITVGGDPIDYDTILNGILIYDASTVTINGRDDFLDALVDYLTPLSPILDFLLSGEEIGIIPGTFWNGAQQLTEFLTLYGIKGYERGLLPILTALTAADPSNINNLMTPAAWTGATAANRMRALVAPIADLLDSLVANPYGVLLTLLPNAAYILSDTNDTSVLEQAFAQLLAPVNEILKHVTGLRESILAQDIEGKTENLLNAKLDLGDMVNELLQTVLVRADGTPLLGDMTVDSLVIGTRTEVPSAYKTMGKNNLAYYVTADTSRILAQILLCADIYDLMELNNLEGLAYFLTNTGAAPNSPKIDYASAPHVETAAIPAYFDYNNDGGYEELAYLTDNADALIQWFWNLIYQKADVREAFRRFFGSNLIMKESFEETVGTVFAADAPVESALAWLVDIVNEEVIPLLSYSIPAAQFGLPESYSPLTLRDILYETVWIGDRPLDLEAVLAPFQALYASGVHVADETEAYETIVGLVEALMPILDFLLADQNVRIMPSNANAQFAAADGTAVEEFLRAWGNNGYETAILPLLLAISGEDYASSGLVPPAVFNAQTTTDNIKAKALIDPLIALFDRFAKTPVSTLLNTLPNLAYFIGEYNGKSLLQQSIDNLLCPVHTVLEAIGFPLNSFLNGGKLPGDSGYTDIRSLGVNAMLDAILADIEVLNTNGTYSLASLLYGTLTAFAAPYNAVDIGGNASYVDAAQADILCILLSNTGILEQLEDNSLEGFLYFLQNFTDPGDPASINYDKAPDPVRAAYPDWFLPTDAAYITANLDTIINYVWNLVYSKADGKAFLNEWLGEYFTVGPTLTGTLESVYGTSDYVASTLQQIVDMVNEKLIPVIDSMSIPATAFGLDAAAGELTLSEILENIVTIGGKPLDLEAALAPFRALKGKTLTVADEAEARARLIALTANLMPVLDLLLDGADLEVAKGGSYTIPNGGTIDSFLRAYGSKGYEKGLLPILLALVNEGAADPAAGIMTPAAFSVATPEEKAAAIIDPLLYVVKRIAEEPAYTVLQLIPNMAYFLSDKDGDASSDESLLQQAVTNLLAPITLLFDSVGRNFQDTLENLGFTTLDTENLQIGKLIETQVRKVFGDMTLDNITIGDEVIFSGALAAIGTPAASYVQADLPNLLVQFMHLGGVVTALEENGLTGLTYFLRNFTDLGDAASIDYDQAPNPTRAAYPDGFTEDDFGYITDNLDLLLNRIWNCLYTAPGGETFLTDLLGTNFTIQATLEDTVHSFVGTSTVVSDALQAFVNLMNREVIPQIDALAIPAADLGLDPAQGELTVSEILENLVSIGGKPLDLEAALAPFRALQGQTITVADEEEAKAQLITLVENLMPFLNIFLDGADIELLKGGTFSIPAGGTTDSLLRAWGNKGYEKGLLPILMALVNENAADPAAGILTPAEFGTASNAEKAAAILDPILYLLDKLASDPAYTLLQLIPNAAFFLSDKDGDAASDDSLLQQAITNLLYPITLVLGSINWNLQEILELNGFTALNTENLQIGKKLETIFDSFFGGVTLAKLTIGDEIAFTGELNAVGIPEASYVKADLPNLLLQFTALSGVFGFLEEHNLTALIYFLHNFEDDQTATDINYEYAPKEEVYSPSWITE
ncbi:MAG: hypothetical protein LBR73_06795, partial [Oscillospiraceae bacterium]|nr:hypothetical protein [Oscillospiraceae bacterium]